MEQVIQLERSARKWPGIPEQFSFFLMEDGEAKLYRLRHDWIDFSGNYTLFDQTGAKIGHLTGHFFDVGGRWDVRLYRCRAPAQLVTRSATRQRHAGISIARPVAT